MFGVLPYHFSTNQGYSPTYVTTMQSDVVWYRIGYLLEQWYRQQIFLLALALVMSVLLMESVVAMMLPSPVSVYASTLRAVRTPLNKKSSLRVHP